MVHPPPPPRTPDIPPPWHPTPLRSSQLSHARVWAIHVCAGCLFKPCGKALMLHTIYDALHAHSPDVL